MKLISPSNKEVDIGDTLLPDEYIGMVRREVLDTYLRDRAISLGATAINGLVTEVTLPTTKDGTLCVNLLLSISFLSVDTTSSCMVGWLY
jgi:geranylgeranyl reductase